MAYDKTVILPVDPETAFELITQPERLRRWKTVAVRIDLRLGGEYRWTITPGNTASGTITNLEPGKSLEYTWGWDGSTDLPPGASKVTVTLESVVGGTSVRLVHEGLTPEQETGHAEGWDHYLARLVQYATTGDAGADPWAAAPEHLDELTSAEAVLAIAQRVVSSVNTADLQNSTPCADFNLAQLLDHQYDSIVRIASSLNVAAPPVPNSSFEVRLADLSQKTIEAFRSRGLSGLLQLGPNEMPANVVANILNIELLVHAIDIAKATHQQVEVSPALAEYVLGLARKTITPQGRASGLFGEEITVSDPQDALTRLLAFTGRAK
jgi:uncharacterized protein (TIGR03086 family)